MSICSYIDDITWDMMSEAGIDISLVERQPTPDGGDEYVLIDGDLKVAFGPATTEQGDPALGWDIATYQRETDSEGGCYWEHGSQSDVRTAEEAIKLVAAAIA